MLFESAVHRLGRDALFVELLALFGSSHLGIEMSKVENKSKLSLSKVENKSKLSLTSRPQI